MVSSELQLQCLGCSDGEGFGPLSPVYSDLTVCFIDGVLLNGSSLFLLLVGSYQLYQFQRQKKVLSLAGDLNSWTFYLKLGLVSLQVVFQLILVLSALKDHELKDLAVSTPVLSALALLIGLWLHYVENFKSRIPSGILLFYWLFVVIFGTLKVANLTVRSLYGTTYLTSIFVAINALFILLLESAIPRKFRTSAYSQLVAKSPYDTANVFSRITFAWMTKLMRDGYNKYLLLEDLPPLPEYLATKNLSDKLSFQWHRQLNHSKRKPSLVITVVKLFGGPFLLAALFKAIQDLLQFTQPQLLKILIQFVNDYNESPDDDKLPLTRGLMIVSGMFFVSIIQTLFLHQYFQISFDMGMKVKSSLTSAIYNKSLNLSNQNKLSNTTGDIVNLMSVDTQRLQDLTQYINILWSGPFQIIICLASLHGLLGNAMWVGVLIMIIMVPINASIARYQKKLQKTQMKNKDARTGVISEILNNIKSLKLYGWEIPYKEKLNFVRNERELKNLKKMGIFQSFSVFTWNCAPFFVSCSTFAAFIFLHKDIPLSTDIVFPALSLFNLLAFPLAVFPNVVTSVVELQVAISRITNFLTSEELQFDSITRLPLANKQGEECVKIDNGEFLWSREPFKVALSNINFIARKGELNCIIGKVGMGKSSMIQAILGDIYKSNGNVITHGSVAYVPQVPWIMNATIRENILFGCRYDPEFYEQTLKVCALERDLEILPNGDKTQVGEKGISLSGGQKARLSLARAVYARLEVYLLDDPLCAVDEHVGKHLINQVLGPNGLLRNKCRILTTNNLNVLRYSNHITMLQNGKIIEEGSYDNIMSAESSLLKNLVLEFGKKPASDEPISTVPSSVDVSRVGSESNSTINEEWKDVESLRRASIATFKLDELAEDDDLDKKLREEQHQQGKVKWDVYIAYAKACNLWGVLIFMVLLILSMGMSTLGNVWLKHWSEVNTEYGYNPNSSFYLLIYLAFGLTLALIVFAQTVILMIFCTIQLSKYLHSKMTDSVLKLPMSFFETTPIGRILNRFSNDIYKVDEVLGRVFSQFFSNSVRVIFTIIVICSSTWQFIFFVIPMGVLYIYYQQYYMRTSRELRRLDSVSRSPIFAHFQETLNGVSTIRAYDQISRFEFLSEAKIDRNMTLYHPSVNANRWLAVRLEFIGSLVILFSAGLAVVALPYSRLTAGLVGLSVSYALQITQTLNWIVRMTVEIETNIVSVERIEEYSVLTPELPDIIDLNRPPTHWPFNGEIKFNHYYTKYRPDLDYCLKDIDITIKPREKIGIVGRTGAGKSSLTMALFRIIESSKGNISIDSIGTDSIGLADLRHKLSIIPQDSQVFEGTIRENLDPTHQHSDEQIWHALELSHLRSHILTMGDGSLDVKLSEGGSNLSVGQRQLICLARALLIESTILVLDEATLAVDVETDKVLQETIRSEFKNRTILTIAHRLNTIIDSDRIIVLERGQVLEFDTPEKLLQNKESLFYLLCKEGGLVEE